jgi:hypothetical protein
MISLSSALKLKTDPSGEFAKTTERIGMSVEVACGMLAGVIDKLTRLMGESFCLFMTVSFPGKPYRYTLEMRPRCRLICDPGVVG